MIHKNHGKDDLPGPTNKVPRFVRELTAFDQPTTYCLTVDQNRAQNEREYKRRSPKPIYVP